MRILAKDEVGWTSGVTETVWMVRMVAASPSMVYLMRHHHNSPFACLVGAHVNLCVGLAASLSENTRLPIVETIILDELGSTGA